MVMGGKGKRGLEDPLKVLILLSSSFLFVVDRCLYMYSFAMPGILINPLAPIRSKNLGIRTIYSFCIRWFSFITKRNCMLVQLYGDDSIQ